MRYVRSEEVVKVAEALMSGGVNDPVRVSKSVGTPAIFIDHGKGSRICDTDGNGYINYVSSWGLFILGHRDPQVINHLHGAIGESTSFSASALLEDKLAQLVIDRVSSIKKMHTVSSGMEATLDTSRLARGHTGRNKIIKFGGYYHGHSDPLLIKAGLRVVTLGSPGSPGVSEGITKNTVTVPYDDLDALKITLEKFGNDIAGVIVEPIAGSMGVVPPVEGFLQGSKDVTTEHGALLIFDEVIAGFRVGYRCTQGHFGVTPDLTCLGKVISEGLPVGVFDGKKEIMDHIVPLGNIYQAGTLSGSPLAMTSGYETLSQLTPETYEHSNTLGDILEGGSKRAFAKYNVPITVNRADSMIGYFSNEEPVTNFEQANKSDLRLFTGMYREAAKEGVLLPPSQLEGAFLSTAHTKEDVEKTIQALNMASSRIIE